MQAAAASASASAAASAAPAAPLDDLVRDQLSNVKKEQIDDTVAEMKDDRPLGDGGSGGAPLAWGFSQTSTSHTETSTIETTETIETTAPSSFPVSALVAHEEGKGKERSEDDDGDGKGEKHTATSSQHLLCTTTGSFSTRTSSVFAGPSFDFNLC